MGATFGKLDAVNRPSGVESKNGRLLSTPAGLADGARSFMEFEKEYFRVLDGALASSDGSGAGQTRSAAGSGDGFGNKPSWSSRDDRVSGPGASLRSDERFSPASRSRERAELSGSRKNEIPGSRQTEPLGRAGSRLESEPSARADRDSAARKPGGVQDRGNSRPAASGKSANSSKAKSWQSDNDNFVKAVEDLADLNERLEELLDSVEERSVSGVKGDDGEAAEMVALLEALAALVARLAGQEELPEEEQIGSDETLAILAGQGAAASLAEAQPRQQDALVPSMTQQLQPIAAAAETQQNSISGDTVRPESQANGPAQAGEGANEAPAMKAQAGFSGFSADAIEAVRDLTDKIRTATEAAAAAIEAGASGHGRGQGFVEAEAGSARPGGPRGLLEDLMGELGVLGMKVTTGSPNGDGAVLGSLEDMISRMKSSAAGLELTADGAPHGNLVETPGLQGLSDLAADAAKLAADLRAAMEGAEAGDEASGLESGDGSAETSEGDVPNEADGLKAGTKANVLKAATKSSEGDQLKPDARQSVSGDTADDPAPGNSGRKGSSGEGEPRGHSERGHGGHQGQSQSQQSGGSVEQPPANQTQTNQGVQTGQTAAGSTEAGGVGSSGNGEGEMAGPGKSRAGTRDHADIASSRRGPGQTGAGAHGSESRHSGDSGISFGKALDSRIEGAKLAQTQPQGPNRTLDPQDLISQVVSKAKMVSGANSTSVVVSLRPENLGKVEFEIIYKDGTVTARFVSESNQVKETLESNLDMLRQSLADKGINVGNLEVSVGQGRAGSNPWESAGGGSGGETAGTDEPAAAEEPVQALVHDGLINIVA